MDKTLTAVMGGMLALVIFAAIAQMAQAAVPQPQYTCPICGGGFYTYDELYSHFVTEHPTTPIDIIWE